MNCRGACDQGRRACAHPTICAGETSVDDLPLTRGDRAVVWLIFLAAQATHAAIVIALWELVRKHLS